MATTHSSARSQTRSWLFAAAARLLAALRILCGAALIVWATLAVYFSNLPWAGARVALAAAFAAISIWCLWISRQARMRCVFVGLFAAVYLWHDNLRPSHDRPWRPDVAVMPRAVVSGDRVLFTGVRNFDYRSLDDFTVRYEEREVSLAHLVSVDLFLSYWSVGPVGHTFVSFNFDNAPPVCISIETRPEVGEGFAPVASLFKQFELIYVVGDERDLVGVRTNFRREEVFLYRLRTSPEGLRLLFLTYIERINGLADQPEFYHLLSNSCTVNIVRYANVAGRQGGFDFRHLLNGWVDRYLYDSGTVDRTLPFEELRRQSRINEAAEAAKGDPDFSRRIRAGLPG